MQVFSRVCAEFHDAKGEVLFRITPDLRNRFIEAPESIKQDLLYRMLINEGSMEVAVTREGKAALENDPMAGHEASGKTIQAAPEDEPEAPAEKADKPAKTGRSPKADKSAAAEAAPADKQ